MKDDVKGREGKYDHSDHYSGSFSVARYYLLLAVRAIGLVNLNRRDVKQAGTSSPDCEDSQAPTWFFGPDVTYIYILSLFYARSLIHDVRF